MKKRGGLSFVCKILSWIICSYTFYISFQENAVLHIVNGDCAIEDLKDSWIEGDFLSWLNVLHDRGLYQKDLVWRNYLKFVQTSLRIVIRQYLKKRRMLFRKGILFSANVTNTTKWFFGTALNCLISCISFSCYTVLRKLGINFSTWVSFVLMTICGWYLLNLCRSGLKRENRFLKKTLSWITWL